MNSKFVIQSPECFLRELWRAKPAGCQRKIHPSHRSLKSRFLLSAFVILSSAVFLFPSPASAGPGLPGHWHGSPDPDACNTFNDCIFIFDICYQGRDQTLGSHVADPLQHAVLVNMIGATFGQCPPPPPVPLDWGERCKLLDIDSPIFIGPALSFSARWRGNIEGLRFQGPSGIVIINPFEASMHFEDGARAGAFSTMDASGAVPLLSPGNYQVSCMGPGGTLGESISVKVTK